MSGHSFGVLDLKMSSKTSVYLLIAIILLGVFLRFYSLSEESFWLDEGQTALAIKKYSPMQMLSDIYKTGAILPEYYSGSYSHELPMYHLFLIWWAKIFGVSEFSLRSFSAILGSLALIVIFYLARYLFDEKIALLSAFLASINLTLIWYSQEARQYSYLLFLSLLSVIFLLRTLRESKTRDIAGLLIVNALLIYSHFPWLVFIAFEGVYAAYVVYNGYTNKKPLNKKLIIAFLIMGILYLPIIGRALSGGEGYVSLYGRPTLTKISEFGVQLSTWLYPTVSMREKIYGFSFNFSVSEWALLLSVLVTALVSGLLFFNGMIKSFYKKRSAIFMLLFFFFPLLFALLLSSLHPIITIFQVKQLIYIIPAFLIIVSIGILKSKWKLGSIAAIILLSVLPLSAYYSNPDKHQIREAADFLPEDENIFINAKTAQVVFKYYYGEKPNAVGVKNLEDLKPRLKNIDSFWMLLTFTKYSDPSNSIRQFLDKNYKLTEKKEFFDIELLHYSKLQ